MFCRLLFKIIKNNYKPLLQLYYHKVFFQNDLYEFKSPLITIIRLYNYLAFANVNGFTFLFRYMPIKHKN